MSLVKSAHVRDHGFMVLTGTFSVGGLRQGNVMQVKHVTTLLARGFFFQVQEGRHLAAFLWINPTLFYVDDWPDRAASPNS